MDVNNIVNLAIVFFCFCGTVKMIIDYQRTTDEDDRIATIIILGVVVVLAIGNGLYYLITSADKALDIWINLFLCVVFGLLLQQLYKVIKSISMIPAKAFTRLLIVIGIIATSIEIFL